MQQIIVQKRFLILVEISEDIWKAFLVIVHFIVEFVEDIAQNVKQDISNAWNIFEKRVFNFVRALFGFNIYKLNLVKVDNKNLYLKDHLFHKNFNQERFLKYSNLLAPPIF